MDKFLLGILTKGVIQTAKTNIDEMGTMINILKKPIEHRGKSSNPFEKFHIMKFLTVN